MLTHCLDQDLGLRSLGDSHRLSGIQNWGRSVACDGIETAHLNPTEASGNGDGRTYPPIVRAAIAHHDFEVVPRSTTGTTALGACCSI